jgi:hypothetical protein
VAAPVAGRQPRAAPPGRRLRGSAEAAAGGREERRKVRKKRRDMREDMKKGRDREINAEDL